MKLKLESKNIFISVSCINPYTHTFNDAEDRLDELINFTLSSCSKIKDSVHIVSEGSILSQEQEKRLEGKCILFQYKDDLEVRRAVGNKQNGAMILWIKCLEKIEVRDDSNIFFIPGRYRLTEGFDVSNFEGDYVFKKRFRNSQSEWLGLQLFKIKGCNLNAMLGLFRESLSLIESRKLDVEHSLLISLNNNNVSFEELDMVYCEGHISGNKSAMELH
jgi:hypothetical protein